MVNKLDVLCNIQCLPVVHELLLEVPVHVFQVGHADRGRAGIAMALDLHLHME
jgi:hypothetical protein